MYNIDTKEGEGPHNLRGPLLEYLEVSCPLVCRHQVVVFLFNLGERHRFAIHWSGVSIYVA